MPAPIPTVSASGTAEDVHAGAWRSELIARLAGKQVYLTIDVDGLDPAIVPATGTPEPDGLTWRETLDILRAVAQSATMIGLDCVELAPHPGQHAADFAVAKLVYKAITYAMTALVAGCKMQRYELNRIDNDKGASCNVSKNYAICNEVKAFIKHHYRHFNAAALIDAAEGYREFIGEGGHMFLAMAGAMSSGELGLVAGRDDPRGQDSRHQLHGRKFGGGCLQPGGARPLCAHPQLPRPHAGGRARTALAPPQPRDRHLHPRGGGDPPHRGRDPGRVDAGRRARANAIFRTSFSTAFCSAGGWRVLSDRPQG